MARTPGQRAGLDRAAVLTAAREVLAERGVAGLSMRAVARQAGVAPNALYSHVADRAALMDALLDDLLAAVPVPADDAVPAAGLREVMLATFDLLARHPDLVPLYLSLQGARGPHAWALGEAMAALLVRDGVAQESVPGTVRALVVHTLGFAALAAGDGPVPLRELRGNLDVGLGWLLVGAGLRPVADAGR